MYLLDTNVCIHALRKKGNRLVKQRLLAAPAADVRLCAPVEGELFCGAAGSANPAAEYAQAVAFMARYATLPFDRTAAEEYGRVRADLEARGQVIGHNDMQIAAIAMVHGLTLVTHNTKEFARVPGLRIEDWELP